MNNIPPAVQANLVVIEQGLRLLDELGAERYALRIPLCFNSSIGGHMRHVIEHYLSFLPAVETGEIDYEARPRDAALETDVICANAALDSIRAELERFTVAGVDAAVRVHAETSPHGASFGSSLGRELEFLLSHTIHHYALIAVMARLQGVVPEATFGIAPSTLRHSSSRSAVVPCAR